MEIRCINYERLTKSTGAPPASHQSLACVSAGNWRGPWRHGPLFRRVRLLWAKKMCLALCTTALVHIWVECVIICLCEQLIQSQISGCKMKQVKYTTFAYIVMKKKGLWVCVLSICSFRLQWSLERDWQAAGSSAVSQKRPTHYDNRSWQSSVNAGFIFQIKKCTTGFDFKACKIK